MNIDTSHDSLATSGAWTSWTLKHNDNYRIKYKTGRACLILANHTDEIKRYESCTCKHTHVRHLWSWLQTADLAEPSKPSNIDACNVLKTASSSTNKSLSYRYFVRIWVLGLQVPPKYLANEYPKHQPIKQRRQKEINFVSYAYLFVDLIPARIGRFDQRWWKNCFSWLEFLWSTLYLQLK